MKLPSWLRGIADNKPVSLSLSGAKAPAAPATPTVDIVEIARQLGLEGEAKLIKATTGQETPELRSALLRVLEASERKFGSDSVATGIILEHLGMVQVGLAPKRDFTDAVTTWVRALSILEKHLGPSHANTIRVRHFLGALYMHMQAHGKSIELLERNLAFLDASGNESFSHFDQMLSSLAVCYRATGQLGKSEQCWTRCVRRAESHRGSDHPETAAARVSLANFLANSGRYTEALPLIENALPIFTKSYPPTEPRLTRANALMTAVQSAIAGRSETQQWLTSLPDRLKTVTDVRNRVTFRLPDIWEYSAQNTESLYKSSKTPQYNFLVSRLNGKLDLEKPLPAIELLQNLASKIPAGDPPDFYDLGPDRAMAYRTIHVHDPSGQKADRSWYVLRKRQKDYAVVISTLSVLYDLARKEETQKLVEVLTSAMKQMRFDWDDETQTPFVN
jgi:tetratricopeptide (TPR) repeat protein